MLLDFRDSLPERCSMALLLLTGLRLVCAREKRAGVADEELPGWQGVPAEVRQAGLAASWLETSLHLASLLALVLIRVRRTDFSYEHNDSPERNFKFNNQKAEWHWKHRRMFVEMHHKICLMVCVGLTQQQL